MKTRHAHAAAAFLGLASITAVALAQSSAQSTRATAGSIQTTSRISRGCPDTYSRAPILVYDRTGSTLVGPTHEQLSVYRDGLATYSRLDYQDPAGRVVVRTLSRATVDALASALLAAGADLLCDDPTQITDVPLATVTVLQGSGADALAHSFSYYAVSAGAPALVESIVGDFIAAEMEGS